MSATFTISCTLDTTDTQCPLAMEIWVDDHKVFDQIVTGPTQFTHDLAESDAQHSLKFLLKGKKPEHTTITESGEIVKDARLAIKDLCFDQIALGQIFIQNAVYTHDYNGTGPQTQHKFYQEMGCNGVVQLDFTTPVYLWLLENM
jgi:hypothetical protein